jgi:hypothetical protein
MKSIFSFVLFALAMFSDINPLLGQWVQTNGPYSGQVSCVAMSANGAGGMNLFAGTRGDGVFLSTNSGASPVYGGSWTPVNFGLLNKDVLSLAVGSNGAEAIDVFAGTTGNGVFVSSDNGASWTQVNSGLRNLSVLCLAVSPNGADGSNLFAGTNGLTGVFISTDNGTSWTPADAGLPNAIVQCLAVNPNGTGGTKLFAGVYGEGVFLSTNNGTSWTKVNSGLQNTYIHSLAVNPSGTGGTKLFAGTYNGVFLSTDNGASWTEVNSGLTRYVYCLVVYGTNLFAGTYNGVFLSTDDGTSWAQVSTDLANTHVQSFVVNPEGIGGPNLFAGTISGGVYRSTNSGASWIQVNSGLMSTLIWCLAVGPNGGDGTNLFAGTNGRGVFVSGDNGAIWTEVSSGLASMDVLSLAVSSSSLYAGTRGNGVWRRPLSEMITSVGTSSADVPMQFSLSQNYPNPFNPRTSFRLRVPSLELVSIDVFDVLGRKVATLLSEVRRPGVYTVTWDAAGLPNAVYFCRMHAGEFIAVRKVVLLN